MDEFYMARCLELARKGAGATMPNPMVGCVIVSGDRIIGEGYHRAFGEAHAEVNAIAAVKDPGLLAGATLYVNLEPCSHFGKTPPCSQLLVDRKLKRVVIGTMDPNPLVAGRGIKQLEENGISVESGVLEGECLDLNPAFFTFHKKKRPWIMLKWAKTSDGFFDRHRSGDLHSSGEEDKGVNWITGKESRILVHKWRSEVQSILVGTRTALVDDPELTVRDWHGRNPLRLVIDRKGILPDNLKLFNGEADTIVFSSIEHPAAGKEHPAAGKEHPAPEKDLPADQNQSAGTDLPSDQNHDQNHPCAKDRARIECIHIPEDEDYLPAILRHLYTTGVQSLMVEGGAKLLNSFIHEGLWDEARVFTGDVSFEKGIDAPRIPGDPIEVQSLATDRLEIFRNS